jgi:hypothetical protein
VLGFVWVFAFFLQTLLAESYKLELVPENPVLGQPAKRIFQVFVGIV